MPSPTEISAQQLARLIGTHSAPVVIDICIDEDFNADPRLIPTAKRHAHTSMEALAPSLAGESVVVVCQKGLKLSQGAAALLRCHGIAAEHLAGGNFGWRDAGLPLMPASILPSLDAHGSSLWVTRQRPKIDRIACPWLIRRFVDRDAKFLFVAASQVEAVAERFGATPFDMETGFWSHRGDKCTFDTMLDEFNLTFPALQAMATIIRAADTNRHERAPQAAGLLAMSVGLSRQFRDDLEQLEAAMIIYDALYRWARDGQDEEHDWPPAAKARL
ncbi:chromate resistance protein ChrB domain-containing protein [Pseudahrensia aquimaris]|uniref:Chromate resistance protein ChrB domain-containing protein n=1 Tax=Pseudahrensia aquimaris TaxID=744461 RepID=A0ABW3FFZ6_9HYPH